jgi:tetratricopeptide (TPR) repeat protein
VKTFQERANEFVQKGNAARSRGQVDAAIRAYREAIELVPAYASLNLVVGDMRFETGGYGEAAEAYQQVVAFDPGHDQAWAGLGQSFLLLDDFERAADAFESALAANPSNVEANYYGSLLAARAGDPRSAADRLYLALSQRPLWEARAREEPLLAPLFETSRRLANLGRTKRWWEIWK